MRKKNENEMGTFGGCVLYVCQLAIKKRGRGRGLVVPPLSTSSTGSPECLPLDQEDLLIRVVLEDLEDPVKKEYQ